MKNLILTLVILIASNKVWADCAPVMDTRFENTWSLDLYTEVAKAKDCDFNQKLSCTHVRIKIPMSALSCAVALGYTDTVERLIRHDVDVNSQDSEGKTPLMRALEIKDLKIMQLLMKKNPDLTLKSKENKTILDYANGRSSVALNILIQKSVEDLKPSAFCHLNGGYESVSTYFFVARAMSNADPEDQKLKKYVDLIQPFGSEAYYTTYCRETAKHGSSSNTSRGGK